MSAFFVRIAALLVLSLAGAVAFQGSPAVQAGGDSCHEAPEYEATGADVKMMYNCFAPSVLRVEPGTTVAFRNHDRVEHTISGIPDQPPGEARVLGYDGYTATFSRPGIYPYFCNLHFGMVGAIVVGESASASAKTSSASAVQAAQPRSDADGAGQPAAAAASIASPSANDDGGLPLVIGLAAAALGLVTAGAITVRRWSRQAPR